VDKSLNTASPL